MSSVLYALWTLSAMALSYESPTVPGEAAIWNRCQTLWYTLLMYGTPWSLWWPSRLVSLWETAQYILCSNAFNGNCVVFIVDDSPSHDATREHVCNKHVYTRKPQMWVWHTWISVTCSRLGAYAVKSRFTRSGLPPVPFTLLVGDRVFTPTHTLDTKVQILAPLLDFRQYFYLYWRFFSYRVTCEGDKAGLTRSLRLNPR